MRRRLCLVPLFALTLVASPPHAALAQAPLGSEFRVGGPTFTSRRRPRIATDAAGNFVVVSQSLSYGTDYFGAVVGQRYASTGASIGGVFQVNSYTSAYQGNSTLAVDSAGNFVVVWESLSPHIGFFGQRFSSAAASVGGEFQINTVTSVASGGFAPAVAMTPSGGFVVAWDGPDDPSGSSGIFARRYDGSGAPAGAEFRANTFTSSQQMAPSVAVDGAGNFLVVWHSQSGGSDVFGQRYGSSGGTLGGEFGVNAGVSGVQSYPSAAIEPSGGFVVVWQSSTGDGGPYSAVLGRRFTSAGAPIGGDFRVNTYTTSNQARPVVSAVGGPGFVVTWQSLNQDGSNYGVFGQVYDSSGSRAGSEFRVSTFTTGYQFKPSLAGQPGGFVVVWQSNQLSPLDDAFGQRYCSTPLTSITIDVSGSTTVCMTGTGGLVTETDSGGGSLTYQWGYRLTSMGSTMDIPGQTGTSYTISGPDFPGAGTFNLVCRGTNPCGGVIASNELAITVEPFDAISPVVTPPAAATAVQTLCL